MKIGDSTSANMQTRGLTTTTPQIASVNTSNIEAAPSTSAAQMGSVSISGEALMLSRLYGSKDPNTAPPQTQLNKSNMSMDPVDWLTQGDRDTLANMYSYAQQQGADLHYVDTIANDLGMYRKFGQSDANVNSGGMFDSEGHAQTYSFTTQDAATASDILSSDAIKSTTLDQGFLNFELNPGYSFNHTANFQFLGQMVNHFSDASANGNQSLSQQFTSYVPTQNFVVHTASEVTLHTEQPDFGNDNGVLVITEKGAKNGWKIVNGQPAQSTPTQSNDKAALAGLIPPKPAPTLLTDLLAMWQKITKQSDKAN